MQHGRYVTYAAQGCRCSACREANRLYRRDRRAILRAVGQLKGYPYVPTEQSRQTRRQWLRRFCETRRLQGRCWRCGQPTGRAICGVCAFEKAAAAAERSYARRKMYQIYLEGQRAIGSVVNAWLAAQRNY